MNSIINASTKYQKQNTYNRKKESKKKALPSTQTSESGFNLIEISITLSIISIIFSSALPYFSEIINKIRVRTTTQDLQSDLQLARSHALTTKVNTLICPLAEEEKEECSSDTGFDADWSFGWLIYTDLNNNNKLDDTDSIIQSNALDGKVNIIFNQRGRLRFFNDGSARSAGFYVCSNSTEENRHIRLLYTGRSRTTKIDNEKQQSTCLSSSSSK